MIIRYIRDWASGDSTGNMGGLWVEIQVIDSNGDNVALGKGATHSTGAFENGSGSTLTDGVINTAFAYTNTSNVPAYVQVDLGDLFYIDVIKVWHYFTDSRIFYNTKTEVSTDGVNWITLFDSAVSGTYAETEEGKVHILPLLPPPYYTFKRNGVAYLNVKAEGSQNVEAMGVNDVTMKFTLVSPVVFQVGDWCEVYGNKYVVYRKPEYTKVNERQHEYDLYLVHEFYKLQDSILMGLDKNATLNEKQFYLTGNLQSFADLVLLNANRNDSGWTLGTIDVTGAKTLQFDGENILASLNRIANEFETEFWVEGKTISFTKRLQNSGITLSYGENKGLISISKGNKDANATIFTRLFVEGSERNLPSYTNYGFKRLQLPASYNGKVDNASAIAQFGVIEKYVKFDDVFPQHTGTVTSVGDEFTFYDTNLPFDVNAQLMPNNQPAAYVTFQSGNLAGYNFNINSFDNATKKFIIDINEDERTETLPNATLKPAVGDKYIVFDIQMPQTHITAAENALLAKSNELLAQGSDIDFNDAFTGVCDPLYFKRNNITPVLGQYVRLFETNPAIDVTKRMSKISRDLQNEWKYDITFTDKIQVNTVVREYIKTIEETNVINETVERTIINRDAVRRAAQRIDILRDDVFDPDGYFDGTHLKPETIEAIMATFGYKSGNFALEGVAITLNAGGVSNNFNITAGKLIHFAYDIAGGYEWQMGSMTSSFTDSASGYYIYAKISKTALTGAWVVNNQKLQVDNEEGYYTLLIGRVYPVKNNKREVDLLYGVTNIVGNRIQTGIIQDLAGTNYWNLDTGDLSISKSVVINAGGAAKEDTNKNHLSQPSTYQAGDTWTLATDTVINGQSYKAGEILTSSTTSGSFISAHWTKLVRYTDDTKANALDVRVSDVEAELIDESIFTPKASYSTAHLVLSLFKLIPTAQYAVRIQRTDGQTKDIGFTTSNKINEQEIVTFAEGQECRVNVWYNQVGNNNNPYQNIWANQPAIYSGTDFYKVNGATSIFFDINRGSLQYLMFTNVVNRSAFIAGKFTEDNTHTVWYLGHSSSFVYHTGGTLAIFNQQYTAPEIWNGLIKINGNVKAPTDFFPLNEPVIFSMVHTAQVGDVNRLSSDRIEDGVQGRTCWGNMFTFALFPTDETAQISNIEYDLTTTTTTTKFGLIKAKLAEQEERLNEWASDGSVSPTEKTGLAQTQVEVSKLKDDIVDRATAAGVAYYVFVNTYWIPFNNDLTALTQTTPESISVATAAPNFAANRLNFYNKLNELEKAIQEAIDYKATSAYDAIQAEPLKIRYIKWWQDKNIANPDTGSYFAELKAIIDDGSNIALGKSVTGSFTSTPSPLSSVTDGDISSYAGVNNQAYNWVKIDLGEVREDIKKIDIWGYSFGSYKHQRVSVEVSDDDITYKTVFDTNQTGTYVETPAGKTIQISTTKIEQIDAKAESKAKVYYQDDPPTGLVAENKGYLWIDINDNNKQYTWSGTAWVLTQDSATAQSTANSAASAAASAAAAASSAQASANSKNTTFISPSSSTPTATKINDLWFDTTNKVWKSWNGVSWDIRQDGTLLSMTYLSEALTEGNFTAITAGLTLGSLIAVKKGSPTPVVTAYMNGVASNPIAFAAGVENFGVAGSETQKVAIRTDGSGFLAAGKIYWDTAGNLFVNAVLTSTSGNIAGFEMGSGSGKKWLKSTNGEASILFENLNGNGFIRMNESSNSPMLSIRTDSESRTGISISTYASNAVALQLLANVGSKYAIASAGGHQFYQRSGERWNAPGILAAIEIRFYSSGTPYIGEIWSITALTISSVSQSSSGNRELTIFHNLGHTDYVVHPGNAWNAGNVYFTSKTSASFTIDTTVDVMGTNSRVYVQMIGRNILQPDYYYNTQQTAYAYREDCNYDEEPSQHYGTVYANDSDCTSNISQSDANNKAYQKAYQIAAADAAINGYCTYRGGAPH